jgi:NMD protein affecting ribosome stability and mRNA decay
MKAMQTSIKAARSDRRTRGRAQRSAFSDPYQTRKKPKEPTACPQCGAIYHKGRWQWGDKPDDADAERCPACQRVADRMPAGIVTLHGDFAKRHKDEMMGLMRNEEAAEKSEHPLNRIISIDESEEGLTVNTTDIHLPRRLGEALAAAFHGSLDMHFDENGYMARVDWHPPA